MRPGFQSMWPCALGAWLGGGGRVGLRPSRRLGGEVPARPRFPPKVDARRLEGSAKRICQAPRHPLEFAVASWMEIRRFAARRSGAANK